MKKLLLLIVAIATVSLVSCKKDAASSTSASGADTTAVADTAAAPTAAVAPTPTGDVEKDSKALIDYELQAANKMKTVEDLQAFGGEFDALLSSFAEYYQSKPEESAKFDSLCEKYSKEVGLEKLVEEKTKEVMKTVPEEEEGAAK